MQNVWNVLNVLVCLFFESAGQDPDLAACPAFLKERNKCPGSVQPTQALGMFWVPLQHTQIFAFRLPNNNESCLGVCAVLLVYWLFAFKLREEETKRQNKRPNKNYSNPKKVFCMEKDFDLALINLVLLCFLYYQECSQGSASTSCSSGVAGTVYVQQQIQELSMGFFIPLAWRSWILGAEKCETGWGEPLLFRVGWGNSHVLLVIFCPWDSAPGADAVGSGCKPAVWPEVFYKDITTVRIICLLVAPENILRVCCQNWINTSHNLQHLSIKEINRMPQISLCQGTVVDWVF